MYGGEQLEAEQRVYIYVQQPKRYKTPEDIARKDADIARQIERMQRLIDDLRDYRVALAQRYAELETMPYTRVLTLKRDPSYKGRITYWVTITRRMSDGTETDELCEQILPLTYDTARDWAEHHMDADAYQDEFGPAAEDDSRTVMSLSVRADTADKARRAAAASGCSISEYVEHALLAQLGGDTDA